MTDPTTGPDSLAPFAVRLRYYRQRAGKTRAVLGGLCGRSEEWVKALETGRLLTPRLPILIRLADILGVDDLAALTGGMSVPTVSVRKVGHEVIPKLLDAVLAPPTLTGDVLPSVAALTARVDAAWRLWHSSAAHQSAIEPVLGDLVRDVRVAPRLLEGSERRRALIELARVYHLVQTVAAYSPVAELVWLSADRAMRAAEDADDPAAIAAAAWYYGRVWTTSGQAERAETVQMDAAAALNREDPQHRVLWGQLHLGMSVAVSQLGQAGSAWRYLAAAQAIADELGPTYAHPWLMFGSASVAANAVTVESQLFRPREAIQRAERLDLSGLPSRTRRASAWIGAAHAYNLRGVDDAAIHMLGRAQRASPDTTRRHPTTLALLDSLARRPGALGAEARDLTVELGIGA